MKVLADLSVVPLGVGVSLSEYVAACERILSEAGLQTRLHAHGTNVEGDWDTFFAAVKTCHQTLHEMGAPRVSTIIRVGTRTDRDQTLEDKIQSVESRLGEDAD
jgi:uncharacterized protein (TIGR00106 family)